MILSAQISHKFETLTLDVHFKADQGVTALFGRSGVGKTTVVRAIAGLFRPAVARIAMGEDTLASDKQFTPPHKRRMGYVFQDARLFPHMNVAKNLDYGARFARHAPVAARDEVIALLGLETLLQRRPATLSGGEQQRVAIGRALLSAPRMLLMDEPLASLDAPRKAEIIPYLERLKTELGLPILYVSHSMEEIARLADKLIVLRDGKVATQGPVFDVLSDPKVIQHVGVREAGAIIPAKVLSHGADGISTLQTSAGTLDLPGVSAPAGATLRIRILAQDVILSLAKPEGLSAMNILPVKIQSIREGAGPGAAVQLQLGKDTLIARVTSRSVERMGLKQGLACYAIVKAMAVAPAAIGQT